MLTFLNFNGTRPPQIFTHLTACEESSYYCTITLRDVFMTQTARLMETRPRIASAPSQPVTPSAAQTITQQQPALASPTSTYLPNGYHLPTSPGIPPVTVDRPNLAIRHNISDEELLIRQHESLSAQIQRLHSQQPSLKAFVQTQLEQAFPDVRPLNAETTQHAITKDIATQYPKSLQAFWTTPRPKERTAHSGGAAKPATDPAQATTVGPGGAARERWHVEPGQQTAD